MEIPNVFIRLAAAVQTRKKAHSRLYHLFLTQSIAQQGSGKGYRALARLIRKGYFATLLTSTMDTALEDALEEEGLHPSQYTVLVVGEHSNEQILDALEGQQSGICIVKLLCAQSQSAQVARVLSSDIQDSLQHYFNENIIIMGCMDQEDDAKTALNSHGKGGIYYALQDAPHYNDVVVKCINKQNKHVEDFIITGPYGEFNTFFSTLETLITNNSDGKQNTHPLEESDALPRRTDTIILPPIEDENVDTQPLPQGIKQPAEQRARTTIFISYSHKDDMHLQRLLTHLKPLKSNGLINIDPWSDKNIKPGERWHQKILQAIADASIAILLISADFLASDYIMGTELPPLEEAAAREEMVIVPVIVGFCNYEHTTLVHFQSVNSPSTPLSKTSHDDNDKVWKLVAARVREIAVDAAQSPSSNTASKSST